MTRSAEFYELAPTTDRDARFLSLIYGFGGDRTDPVEHMAMSLPYGGKVIDVGAGASDLGRVMAAKRPDVRWVNYDYSYGNPEILAEVSDGAPENMEFVQGDARQLDQVYGEGAFDRVFSFWLMPHLSLEDKSPAEEAARAMHAITKVSGQILVGPSWRDGRLPKLAPDIIRVVKDEDTPEDSFSDRIVQETRLDRLSRAQIRMMNSARTEVYGTSRGHKGKPLKGEVLDPSTGEYLPYLSLRGFITAGRVALAATRYMTDSVKCIEWDSVNETDALNSR